MDSQNSPLGILSLTGKNFAVGLSVLVSLNGCATQHSMTVGELLGIKPQTAQSPQLSSTSSEPGRSVPVDKTDAGTSVDSALLQLEKNDLTSIFSGVEKGCDLTSREGKMLMHWLNDMQSGKLPRRPDLGHKLNAALGTPKIKLENAAWIIEIPVTGTFRDLTLLRFDRWIGDENDLSGFALIFKEPMPTVKRKLAKIKFVANSEGHNKARFSTIPAKPKRAALICDFGFD